MKYYFDFFQLFQSVKTILVDHTKISGRMNLACGHSLPTPALGRKQEDRVLIKLILIQNLVSVIFKS